MSLKPICVQCQRFYRPDKNGVRIVESMPTITAAPPGNEYADLWVPYKVWRADRWRCEGCGHLLIVGSGLCPEAIHHQPDFNEHLVNIDHIVNDC